VSSGFAFNPCMSESGAGINKILVDEIGGENLKPIGDGFSEALSDEEPGVAMNAPCDGFHVQNGVIGDGRDGVLHPVEVLARRNGWVLAQVL